jgi:hypothetical protein
MRKYRAAAFVFALLVGMAACKREEDAPIATPPPAAPIPATTTRSATISLPKFEDYPAPEIFAGTPAAVNLASHPDAEMLRTQLTEDPGYETRFAGHYRVVEIGCGTACQAIWAVDLIDGSVFSLFTASSGVAYRPDSRLIVMNDPAFFEEMLETASVAVVEEYMATYGAPVFWLEEEGEFEWIGPEGVRIDPVSGELEAEYCGINGEIRSAGFSPDGNYFVLTDAIGGFPLLPEARIFVVEVATNDCAPGGCESLEGEFDSEDDEDVVLSRLEESTSPLRERLGLVPPQATKRFAPRSLAEDLFAYDIGDQSIEVLLRQDNVGDIGDRKSSLQLEVRAGGIVRELDSLEHYRDEIVGYRLGDLYLSPDGKSIAIVVEMKYEILGHAPSTYCRYMVETVSLY